MSSIGILQQRIYKSCLMVLLVLSTILFALQNYGHILLFLQNDGSSFLS